MIMRQKGYTMIEIVLVVAIISTLFAVVLVVLAPARRLAEANDDSRRADLSSLLSAVQRYQAFNRGNLPPGFDSVATSSQVIGTNASDCNATCTATTKLPSCLDLSASLVEAYLAEIPVDPQTGSSGNTDYFANKYPDGKIVLGACDPEAADAILLSR